jgi:predicted GNAT superfamily acetyltransferase
MTPAAELVYRACSSLDDFRQCVRLQKEVWGFDELETLPARVFVVADEIGGQVFGAFEPSGNMVGFLIALPGMRQGVPFFHSHMLAVVSEYRNRGLGRRLKRLQRDHALAHGVRLVEWTFDPLEPKNAFFNLERLGAIVRRYVPNRYGITTSGLHGGLPTDRLVAEWRLDSARVAAALEGRATRPPVARRVEFPADIADIKTADREAALRVQSRLREEFEEAFAQGLVAAGFDPAGAYLLTTADAL